MSADLLILGTGALATYFAARCSSAGLRVQMLGSWLAAIDALNRDGARLDGVGSFPVQATCAVEDCRGASLALVLVKAWQTERAAEQLEACLARNGLAFTLQNGLGNDAILARRLGTSRVTRGVTTLGVTLLEPGCVALRGEGAVSLQEGSAGRRLAELLSRSGIDAETRGDADALVWGKLIVSSAINPITALLRVENGRLLQDAELLRLAGAVARETRAVAAALQVDLGGADPEGMVARVARQTAGNRSSMLQDVLRGTRTEVDAINGSIVILGEAHAVPTPLNRVLWSLVKAIPFVVRYP